MAVRIVGDPDGTCTYDMINDDCQCSQCKHWRELNAIHRR